MTNPKFKPGDKVKVEDPTYILTGAPMGSIGTIISYSGDQPWIQIGDMVTIEILSQDKYLTLVNNSSKAYDEAMKVI